MKLAGAKLVLLKIENIGNCMLHSGVDHLSSFSHRVTAKVRDRITQMELLSLLILLILVVVDSRINIVHSLDPLPYYVPSPTVDDVILSNWTGGLWYAFPYMIVKALDLPLHASLFLLMPMYRMVMALGIFYFSKRLLRYLFPTISRMHLLLSCLAGSVLVLYAPYIFAADNPSNLTLVKALIPYFLYFQMGFLREGKIYSLMFAALIMAIIFFSDPRGLLTLMIISIVVFLLPYVLRLRNIHTFVIRYSLSLFIGIVPAIISYLLEIEKFSRMNFSEFVPIPVVGYAFVYSDANPINLLLNTAFFGTSHLYTKFEIYPLTLLLPLSLLGLIWFLKMKDNEAINTRLVLVSAVIVLSLISVEPFRSMIVDYVINTDVGKSEIMRSVVLSFRTPRIFETATAFFYSCLGGIALASILSSWKESGDKYITCAYIVVFAFGISGWIAPALISAEQPTFNYERVENSAFVRSLINESVTSNSVWIYPTADEIQTIMGHRPYIEGGSVLRYPFAFVSDPRMSMVINGYYGNSTLAELLRIFGIRYVIVDRYLEEQSENLSEYLSNANGIESVGKFGKIEVYKVSETPLRYLSDKKIGIIGGLSVFAEWLDFTDNKAVPYFLDGLICKHCILPNTIISSPHRDINDIITWKLLNTEGSTVLVPSLYSQPDKNYWLPGYISDPHHGTWTSTINKRFPFSWESSYEPRYGFAYTTKQEASLSIPVSIPEKESGFTVLLRVLVDSRGGTLTVDLGEKITIDTMQDYKKSEFKWFNLGHFVRLPNHITITNNNGFNAVNILVIAKSEYFDEVKIASQQLLTNTNISYIIDNNGDSTRLEGGYKTNLNLLKSGTYSLRSDSKNITVTFSGDGIVKTAMPSEVFFLKEGDYDVTIQGKARYVMISEGTYDYSSDEMNKYSTNHKTEFYSIGYDFPEIADKDSFPTLYSSVGFKVTAKELRSLDYEVNRNNSYYGLIPLLLFGVIGLLDLVTQKFSRVI